MAIYYLLTVFSVLMETAKNIFSNMYSKDHIKGERDIYLFNIYMYAGAFAVMLILQILFPSSLSLETAILAALFALMIGGMQTTLLRALRHGPLSYVNFIQTSGLVIPALFGAVCLGQSVSVRQISALPILLFSMALVMDLKKENSGGKWLGDAIGSMVCCGLVGVIQSLHQSSNHADEQNSFLALSFFFVVLINVISFLVSPKVSDTPQNAYPKLYVLPLLSGIFFGIVNALNLFLVGVMPNVIFFPIANGGLLIATMLAAVWIFKESLNRKQWLGILIGVVSMCMLGI